MPTKYDKLKTLLRELLQLDQPDLDFGLYRIMHAKAAEVTQFLEHDLLPQVREALTSHESAELVEARRALADRIELRQRLGDDPEADDEVRRLRQKIAEAGAPPEQLEAEIYLRDYAFRLRPDDGAHDGADPMRVHFQLVDAAEGEHGNVKPAGGKDRVFLLTADDFLADNLITAQPGEPASATTWCSTSGSRGRAIRARTTSFSSSTSTAATTWRTSSRPTTIGRWG